MSKTRIITAAVIAALLPSPAFAGGGGFTGGATLPEQIVQEGTAVEQLAKQAEEVQEQIQMVYQQALNLERLPTQMWSSVQSDLDSLINVANEAQGFSYASQNIASQFSQTYPAAASIGNNYGQQMQSWTTDTNSQIKHMLEQYGLQAGQFSTQQSALQAVENASQSAAGRMQVLQAGNQIAGMLVNQIQQLQQDVMAGNSAIGAYEAQQVNNRQQEDNQVNNLFAQAAASLGPIPTQMPAGTVLP
jgi:P-type conjugative transfer protein TrbJ